MIFNFMYCNVNLFLRKVYLFCFHLPYVNLLIWTELGFGFTLGNMKLTPIYRSNKNRVVAGVVSGLSQTMRLPLLPLRIMITALLFLPATTPFVFGVYVFLWIVMPLPSKPNLGFSIVDIIKKMYTGSRKKSAHVVDATEVKSVKK
jgi:phage shock protein PspC (stress-responsive transcriptional regulator)